VRKELQIIKEKNIMKGLIMKETIKE